MSDAHFYNSDYRPRGHKSKKLTKREHAENAAVNTAAFTGGSMMGLGLSKGNLTSISGSSAEISHIHANRAAVHTIQAHTEVNRGNIFEAKHHAKEAGKNVRRATRNLKVAKGAGNLAKHNRKIGAAGAGISVAAIAAGKHLENKRRRKGQ